MSREPVGRTSGRSRRLGRSRYVAICLWLKFRSKNNCQVHGIPWEPPWGNMWCSMGATDGNPAGSHAVSPVTRTLAVSHRRDRGLTRHPVASTGIPWCPASAPCICHGRPWASVVFSRGSRWDFAVTRMGANGSSHGIPPKAH